MQGGVTNSLYVTAIKPSDEQKVLAVDVLFIDILQASFFNKVMYISKFYDPTKYQDFKLNYNH